jgi:hypothetical protein
MKIYLLTLSLILSNVLLVAGEVDQFTARFKPIQDSSEILNKMANEYLKKSIQEANLATSTCDEKILYKKMRNYFSNHREGEITIFALESPLVDKINLKISESVFKYWDSSTGFLIGNKVHDSSQTVLSPLIKIGDQVIGTDKLEHLFGRGFAYFSDFYINYKTLEQTIQLGAIQERIIYGGNVLATGVFSYADLAANFNGMRFWNHILLLRNDIMESSKKFGPYVVCDNNKFVFSKEIDFRLYFDSAHDEAINCSKFASQKGLENFNKRLVELKNKNPHGNFECPVNNKELDKVIEKYGEFSKYIINNNGHSTVSTDDLLQK